LDIEDASRPEEDDDLAPFQMRRPWELRCIKQERLLQTCTVHISFLFMKKLENYASFFCFKHDQMLDAVNLKLSLKKLSKFAYLVLYNLTQAFDSLWVHSFTYVFSQNTKE
jgi:hypothetical protein